MKFSKVEFGVGAFMIVGILAAVVMSLKVAGLVLDDSGSTYTLHAKFDNIGSLKVRAPVRVGGVVIGRVDKIYLDPKALSPMVDMSINSQYNELSNESRLSIKTAGIIGEQYLALTPGFYDEEMGTEYLKDGDYITDTESALVLEDLISKFLYNSNVANEAGATATNATSNHAEAINVENVEAAASAGAKAVGAAAISSLSDTVL